MLVSMGFEMEDRPRRFTPQFDGAVEKRVHETISMASKR